MSFLFSGIEVPSSLQVSEQDLDKNQFEIVLLGETLEEHIIKGIGLTAHWGDLLREHGFNSNFRLGVYTSDDEQVHHFYPNSEDFASDDDASQNLVSVVTLDNQFIPGIQATSGFYDISPEEAISTGVYLRGRVLMEWENGHRFAYSGDGKHWTVYAESVDQWQLL